MKTITAFAWVAVALIATTPGGSSAVCQTDTLAAEFGAGSGCYVGDASGGEVLLAPAVGAEFDGPMLPPGWGTKDWPYDFDTMNGSATFSGGKLILDGLATWDPTDFNAGHSMEAVATFGAAIFQHVGFGIYSVPDASPFNAAPYAIFSTGSSTTDLLARYDNGSGENSVTLTCSGGCLGVSHHFRIDWTSAGVDFYVDGALALHDARTVPGSDTMRAAVSDRDGGGPALAVDWVHVTPYTTPCTYESAIIDSGATGTDWSDLNKTTVLPSGTGITVYTRTGASPTIDGTWSGYQALSGATTIVSPRGRYLRYRVDLSTTNPDETPELQSAQVCYTPCTPTAEICDGQDNNCNDVIDEGTVGNACASGAPGICGPGTTTCSMGVPGCAPIITPGSVTETCNGADDDCDGSTDEGTVGNPCASGAPGICGPGTTTCSMGTPGCASIITPGSVNETCNGADDDCDGSTDEGDPDGGGACNTGNPGICAAGIQHCTGGSLQCIQTNTAHAETCNNLDDNCDGQTDENNPGGGAGCSTGQPGVCGPGTITCVSGSLVCQPNLAATPEICDGQDNNCVNGVDEGDPGGGGPCNTGNPGICAAGIDHCVSGAIQCVQNVMASTEICDSLADENCDGSVDESPCDLCTAANTVAVAGQTKVSVLKLSADKGKLVTKGTFVLPMAGMIDPVASPVTLRLEDNTGVAYQATIPASSFTGNSSNRSFKFSDTSSPFENGGVQRAKIKISGGDDVTTKYLFKARELDLQSFDAGTGKVTVRIGDRCFRDTADACTLSPSGTKVKCR